MKITTKQIKELKSLYLKKQKLSESISDCKKTYQDRHGKELVKLTRAGKEIELEQNTLWVELFHGGYNSQAGEELAKLYPAMFKMVVEEKQLNEELDLFTVMNWGFFFNQMSLTILMDIVLALIKYQIKHYLFIDRVELLLNKLVYALSRKKNQ